jgi:hypothetical protein
VNAGLGAGIATEHVMADDTAGPATGGTSNGDTAEIADPSTWPAGIRKLAAEELDALGIDVNRRLYWHGKPVLSPTLVLTTAQKVWAIVLTVGALLAFLSTFAQGWVAAFTWMCQVGWIHTWCAAG